ncbi:acyl-CoA thioesterase [Paeniglutamicibacter sp. ORCA_105]|uniref:acyl-CoA thioesterase n=1 Tax=Paeniglutamicibacter sp. ORCA_105 TaxID=3377336 RepID=UPI0038940168
MSVIGSKLDFQLAYGDCDAVGIAYFAIYYRWMERAYSSWLFGQGIRSGEMQDELGVVTVGISSGARYHSTAKVFDHLSCQVVLDRLGTTSYRVGYEFTRDGELVTRGQMSYACRNAGDFTKAPLPERLHGILGGLPAPSFDTEV